MKIIKFVLLLLIAITISSLQILPQESHNHLLKTRLIPGSKFYPEVLSHVNPIKSYNRLFNLNTVSTKHNSGIFIDSAIYLSTSGKNKITYEYDNIGRISSFIWTSWFQNKWTNWERTTETYDSLGNIIFELTSGWDMDYWLDDSRETYNYDSNRNITYALYEIFQNSQWVNFIMDTYKYNSIGNLESDESKYWDSTGWHNSTRSSMFYNSNGDRDSILIESWIDSHWENNLIWTLEYENHKTITSYLAKTWSDSQWVYSDRGNFKYDSNGYWIYGLYQKWDGGQWLDNLRFNYSYNDNNFFTHGLNEIYKDGTWTRGDGIFSVSKPDLRISIISTELIIYYNITSINDKLLNFDGYALSQNYPNPFNPATTIKFSIPYAGFVQLKVYNILGKEIKTLVNDFRSKGNYEVKFDASNLASGIYLYQIISGSYKKSKMMILQK
jgi:hypothetical protein